MVRPRRLEALLKPLAAMLADEDIRMSLGNYLLSKLEDLATQHNAFLAGYFTEAAQAIATTPPDLPVESTPQVLEANIAQADTLITSQDWRQLPALPEEYPELLDQQREALREMASRIDLKADAEARTTLLQMTREGYVTVTATVARLIGRTLEAAGSSKRLGGVAALTGIGSTAIPLLRKLLAAIGLPI